MKNSHCTMYLVRHGESEANVENIRGADTKLTELGKQQIKNFAKKFNVGHFDIIFSSPLIRAKETAEIIALEHKLAIVTKEALRERHSGVLDGKKHGKIKEIIRNYNRQRLQLSYEQTKSLSPAEGFENDEQMMSRVITELREIAIAYPGKTIMIISHWGIMRTLLVHLGYKTFKELLPLKFTNTSYIRLKTDGVDFFVEEVVGLEKSILHE